jgi:quercetin dioxygenase-like cupin family protein
MAFARLPFAALPWTTGAHPLERKKAAAHGATLLEFAPGFADPSWCERGHIGFVISGTVRLELETGVETLAAGEGFATEPGTGHRASNPGTEPVRLFIVTTE